MYFPRALTTPIDKRVTHTFRNKQTTQWTRTGIEK